MSEVAGNAVVRVAALGKRFGGVTALQGVGFAVGRGEVFGLVGPDGAGRAPGVGTAAGVWTSED